MLSVDKHIHQITLSFNDMSFRELFVRAMVMEFNATFNNISIISWVVFQLYWRKKPKKIIDLPQVTDKLYQIMLYQIHLAISGVRTRNVSGGRYL
jgi:hypothetical protein